MRTFIGSVAFVFAALATSEARAQRLPNRPPSRFFPVTSPAQPVSNFPSPSGSPGNAPANPFPAIPASPTGPVLSVPTAPAPSFYFPAAAGRAPMGSVFRRR
jgi:hypothetical protein